MNILIIENLKYWDKILTMLVQHIYNIIIMRILFRNVGNLSPHCHESTKPACQSMLSLIQQILVLRQRSNNIVVFALLWTYLFSENASLMKFISSTTC